MIKKGLAFLICFSLIFNVFSLNVSAKEKETNGYEGLKGPVYSVIDNKENKGEKEDLKALTPVFGSKNEVYLEKFSDTYFYSRMNKAEKAYYDNLKKTCDKYILTNLSANLEAYQTEDGKLGNAFTTEPVSTEGVRIERAQILYYVFLNANPYIYFLSGGILSSKDQIYPMFYEEYANGDIRAEYTKEFFGKINSWIKEASEGDSNYQKVVNAVKVISRDVDYIDDNDWGPHQSAATAVFTGKTVCAGFSECFALVAKAMNIETLVVTSDKHEWNLVKLGDNWFVVDVTQADALNPIDMRGVCVSDENISKTYSGNHYQLEEVYKNLKAPLCPYNYEDAPKPHEVTMWRLIYEATGEHIYTDSLKERDALISIGWINENEGWYAPSYSDIPVYRLTNPDTNDHHFTTDSHERDVLKVAGWIYEGIGWYSSETKGTPIHRVINPKRLVGSHHYTADMEEVSALEKDGWIYEGVAFYGN